MKLVPGNPAIEQSVLQEAPKPTPEELFARHVARVRTEGDVFDARSTLSFKRTGVVAAAVGGASLLAANAEHPGGSVAVGVIAGGVTTVGTLLWTERRAKRDVKEAQKRYDILTQSKNDALYELYAGKKKPDGTRAVTMHWHGPARNDRGATGGEELERIAGLAKDNGVDRLLIGTRLVHACGDGNFGAFSTTSTLQTWLASEKLIYTKGASEHEVVAGASPDDWLGYARAGTPKTTAVIKRAKDITVLKGSALYGSLKAAGAKRTKVPAKDETASPTLKVELPVLLKVQPEPDAQLQIGLRKKVEHKQKVIALREGVYGGVAALCGALGAVAVLAGVLWGDKRYDHVAGDVRAKIARENGADPAVADVDPHAVRERMYRASGGNRIWDYGRSGRNAVTGWNLFDGGSDGGAGQAAGALFDGGVGNIGEQSKEAQWKLSAHNMQEEEIGGNWSVATSSRVEATKKPGQAPEVVWKAQNMFEHEDTVTAFGGKEGPGPDETQWIRVELANANVLRESGKKNDATYVPIPVRDGMVLSAAAMNGIALPWIQMPNGTFALELPGKNAAIEGRLEYWVVPGVAKDRAGPRAIEPLSIPSGGNYLARSNADIMIALNTRVPGFTAMTVSQKTKYLNTKLGYKLDPIPTDTLKVTDEWAEYAANPLDARRANCGYAGTTLLMANMVTGTEVLNAVMSYKNKNGDLTLDVSESHLRAVNEQGTIYDPTPERAMTSKNPAANAAPAEQAPIAPWLLLAGAGVTAVAVYRRRHGINRKITTQAARWDARVETERIAAEAELRGLRPIDLREAQAAVDFARWSKPGAALAYGTIVRQGRDRQVGAEEAVKHLTAPGAHAGPTTRRVLRQQVITPAIKRTLAIAHRAARRR